MKINNISIYEKIIKRMSKWILSIFILSIFSFILTLQMERQYEIICICIGFIFEMIFLPYILKDLIINSIIIKNKIRILSALGTNILFMHHSFIFIISSKYHNNSLFQIFTIVALIVVVVRICKNIVIDKNCDFSILKSINLFFIAGITAILYIIKLNQITKLILIENWINFYYLLPFFITQGMYELLEGRKNNYNEKK